MVGQQPNPQQRFYGDTDPDDERSEPIQSKSFRVLQKLTEGIKGKD